MTPQQEHEMEVAVQLFNNNCDLRDMKQLNNILRALKRFIAINKSFEDRTDATLPRVFSFIALCNYKIGNFDRAYWCAKKSVELGEKAMENSPFTADVNLFLDQQVFVLIDELENKYAEEIDFNRGYIEGEENIFDDTRIQELIQTSGEGNSKPTKEEIKTLIEVVTKVQEDGISYFDNKGDSMQAFQYGQMIEAFKLPLLYAWQQYKYGWHTDFIEEGDSMFPYMMFESQPKKMTQDLINLLRDQSPFMALERNSAITNGLIRIYSRLLSDLKSAK